MQRVILFKKRNFWSSQVDIQELNDKIAALNSEGWKVASIIPSATFAGVVSSYTIVIENEQ